MNLKKKKIAVITEGDSDLLNIITSNVNDVEVFTPGQINVQSLDEFDAIAILGGSSEKPILLHPSERLLVEEQIKKGKRVFAEFCASIGNLYFEPQSSTRYERLVFLSRESKVDGVIWGDLLDDQCGTKIAPYPQFCSPNTPLLKFVTVHAHSRISSENELEKSKDIRALWFDQPSNLLVCAFKMANFRRSRFAPKSKFKAIVIFILEWLLDQKVNMDLLTDYYTVGSIRADIPLNIQVEQSVNRAVQWFEDAGILLDEGRQGSVEGLGTEIFSTGEQKVNTVIRTDCVGEVSMAAFMHFLLTNNAKSKDISDRLTAFCFNNMQCREEGPLFGMVRWTQEAWGVCYQDDVARAIIPQLLKCLYTGKNEYLQECVDALTFLIRTTGTDGTRISRTENMKLNEESIKQMAESQGNFPSAHYNGYYHAALLLAYQLTGIEELKNTAVKGLETIMAVYPETIREQSQTQEYCRLILPLSWLYWVTKEDRHKGWLYKVVHDLQEFKHPSGCYLEWDEGYKASMRNTGGSGECSLLASNGDPVVDLLYSNNWLPTGFIQAYFVTGDSWFVELWEEIAVFMMSAQIQSNDKKIHGAWARGFDANLKEVFGSPADAGWGPWAIESGWTVAEIASGLMMGLKRDKLIMYYNR